MPKQIAIVVLDQMQLEKACRSLARKHAVFQMVLKQHGVPSLRQAPGGLEALLCMVTEQFLSLAAAGAIWARLKTRLGTMDAKQVLACSQDELLALGLSRAKARSFHGLAHALQSGELNFDLLHRQDDEAARKHLIALPGIGPWTAEIYLLSVLLRADVWPWGDVALQAAAQHLFSFAERPHKAEMLALGERFKPHRAAAARLLWSHYRGLRNMPQA